jgi:hypothetical protein
VGQQGIAGEQGGRFIELAMGGGAAPAEVVVIHAGQIVMNERIRVHALHGHGGRHGGAGGPATQLGGSEDQDRAQPFATGLQAVPHRRVQAGGAGACWRKVLVQASLRLRHERV